MSSGQKSCYDDEDAWDYFLNKTGIRYLTGNVAWHAYSDEAIFAKDGYKKYELTGTFLVKYVSLKMEEAQLIKNFKAHTLEYKTYLALKKKYEPDRN